MNMTNGETRNIDSFNEWKKKTDDERRKTNGNSVLVAANVEYLRALPKGRRKKLLRDVKTHLEKALDALRNVEFETALLPDGNMREATFQDYELWRIIHAVLSAFGRLNKEIELYN